MSTFGSLLGSALGNIAPQQTPFDNVFAQQLQHQVQAMTQDLNRQMQQSLMPPYRSNPAVTPADRVTWVGHPGAADIRVYAEPNLETQGNHVVMVRVGEQEFYPQMTEARKEGEILDLSPLRWLDRRVLDVRKEATP